MGAMKRIAEAERTAKRAKNGKKGSGVLDKLHHTPGKRAEVSNTWGEVDSALIGWLVERCTRGGGAVMFGSTRDGGALTLRIYDGDQKPHTEYFGASEDITSVVWSFAIQIAEEEDSPPE